MKHRGANQARRQAPCREPAQRRGRYNDRMLVRLMVWRIVLFVTHLVTLASEVARCAVMKANSGQISTRRDGRVVDGGGLENLNGLSSEIVIFPANFAHDGR